LLALLVPERVEKKETCIVFSYNFHSAAAEKARTKGQKKKSKMASNTFFSRDRLNWGNYYPTGMPDVGKFKKGLTFLEAEAQPVPGRYASRPGVALGPGRETIKQATHDFADGQQAGPTPTARGDSFMNSLFQGNFTHGAYPRMPKGRFGELGVYIQSIDTGDMRNGAKRTNSTIMKEIGLTPYDYVYEWAESTEITRQIGRGLPLFQDRQSPTNKEIFGSRLGVITVITIGRLNKILKEDAMDKKRTIKCPQDIMERFPFLGFLDQVYNNNDPQNEVTLLGHYVIKGECMVSPIFGNHSSFVLPGSKLSGLVEYTVDGREKELEEVRDRRNLYELERAIQGYIREGLVAYFRIRPWSSLDYPPFHLYYTLRMQGEYYKFGTCRESVVPRDSDKMARWSDVETVCYKDHVDDKWACRKNLEKDHLTTTMVVACAVAG
jgi:hypothetical protein